MSTVSQKKHYTPEEYLAFENAAPNKHEYYRGEIFAMTGGTPNHNSISIAIASLLFAQLSGKPCQPFTSDQRISIPPVGVYTYPDSSVVCGGLQFDKRDPNGIINPKVLIEVLSPSTESYDRTTKFDFYRQSESLAEYILVSQDSPRVEHFTRTPDNKWLHSVTTGLEASVVIELIQCRLMLSEVYSRVTFESSTNPLDAQSIV